MIELYYKMKETMILIISSHIQLMTLLKKILKLKLNVLSGGFIGSSQSFEPSALTCLMLNE